MKRLTALTLSAALAAAGCSHGTAATEPAPQQAQTPAPAPAEPQAAAAPSLPEPRVAELLSGTPEAFAAACTADIERVRARVAALKGLDARKDGKAVLAAYDEATAAMNASTNRSSLAREVHPNAAFRDAARDCEQRVDAVNV